MDRSIKTSGLFIFSEYALIISLILHSRTIWSYASGIRGYFSYINVVLLVFSSACCVLFKSRWQKESNIKLSATYSFVIVLILLLIYIFTRYNFDGVMRLSAACVFSIIFVKCCLDTRQDIDDFFCRLVNVIVVIAAISLFFWVFGSIFSIIRPNSSIYNEWANRFSNSYYGLYYETQTAIGFFSHRTVYRNCAVFTEAPMCAFVFCTGLLIYIFGLRGRSKAKIVILVLSIFSTQTSTGYIVLLLTAGGLLLIWKPRDIAKKVLKLLSVFLIFVGISVILSIVENYLGTSSGNIRLDDFAAGMKSWKSGPIFGNGIENVAHIQSYMSTFRSYNQGFSNSFMQILSDGGVVLASIYIACAIKGIMRFIRLRDYGLLTFAIIFLATFAFTLVSYTNLNVVIFTLFGFGNFDMNVSYGGNK